MEGRKTVLKILFDSYYKEIFEFMLPFIDDLEITNDLVADCFLVLYRAKHVKLENVPNVKAFLLMTARNNALNYLKNKLHAEDSK